MASVTVELNFKLIIFFRTSFFFSSLKFTAKLRRGYKDFSCTLCPNSCTASPILNIYHQSGSFVTTDKPPVTHHQCPKYMVYIRVHSWSYTFCRVGEMYRKYPSLMCLGTAFSIIHTHTHFVSVCLSLCPAFQQIINPSTGSEAQGLPFPKETALKKILNDKKPGLVKFPRMEFNSD